MSKYLDEQGLAKVAKKIKDADSVFTYPNLQDQTALEVDLYTGYNADTTQNDLYEYFGNTFTGQYYTGNNVVGPFKPQLCDIYFRYNSQKCRLGNVFIFFTDFDPYYSSSGSRIVLIYNGP